MVLTEVQALPEIRVARKQPKILFIGGTHPRHLYYANEINRRYPLAGVILEQRSGMVPPHPESISKRDAKLWEKHFANRMQAELDYYDYQDFPDTENKLTVNANLETEMNVDFVKGLKPDIVLVFGCGMIRGELAKVLPDLTINLHLGLSPRYRGAATLFWPFYFLEPQWAGCTLHKIVYEPDAGDILHQCVPVLEKGDKIHDVACKAVVKATSDMIDLLGMWDEVGFYYDDMNNYVPSIGWKFYKQTATGKNFLARDFQPSHLRMIYETYNDNIVDEYLDGNLKQHKPKLVRQF